LTIDVSAERERGPLINVISQKKSKLKRDNLDDFDFEEFASAFDRNVGWELEAKDWSVGISRRKELENQTNSLADLLEKAGIQARMDSDVVSISAVTNIATPLVSFRPVRFLPSVAARDRRPMLNALKYWMDNVVERPDYVRYIVITSGSLVPAFGDLKGRLQDMARRVSKWAHAAKRDFDIVVHFRGSEFTRKTAGERELEGYEKDTVLYHPHCNILLEPKRKLAKDGSGSWNAFLKWSHDYLDGHWKDCGRINDVREIVKYVVKPADLLAGEKPIDSEETKWLYESLFRLNLAQPLGDFKEFYSEIKEKKLKVVRVKNFGNNKGKLKLVRKSERLDHSKRVAGEDEYDSDFEPLKKKGPANVILGLTMPSWTHSPWAEPSILVRNYDPNSMSDAAQERLRDIRVEQHMARDLWDRSGAPEPVTALEIARQWASKEGKNVVPFKSKNDQSYNIYNSSLTVPNQHTEKIEIKRSEDPPDFKTTVLNLSKHQNTDKNFKENSKIAVA